MCEQEQEVSQMQVERSSAARVGATRRKVGRGWLFPRPGYRTARHATGQEAGRDTGLMKSCLRHERRDLILSPRQAVWPAGVEGSSATGRLAADLRGSRTESRSLTASRDLRGSVCVCVCVYLCACVRV